MVRPLKRVAAIDNKNKFSLSEDVAAVRTCVSFLQVIKV
jgi:hypothetical protein